MSTPPEAGSSQPPEPDLSGRKLGDYQLLRRLGKGGMAEVYLARQQSLGRQVAFKVLRPSLASDESYVRRFHNEAQAAAKLVHANIVQSHEVGRLEGVHFIAQEYVPGRNLQQVLARQGRGFTAGQTINVLMQVAAALQKAAEQNITHRDIKPENILVSASGEIKVADFGLAHLPAQRDTQALTQVGMTMGTPLYMSPEQIEGKEVDTRSDLYSLGVTAYQMLAGQPPFMGETALAIAVRHLHSLPPPLDQARSDLPAELCRIVHKLLAKKPRDRFQQPAELLKELRSLSLTRRQEGSSGDLAADLVNREIVAPTARLAATQQLASVLKSSRSLSRWPRWLWPLLLVLAAFPLGALLAWITRPRPLLSQASAGAEKVVRKQEDVYRQWYYAALATSNHEQAWKAIPHYFPPADSAENLRYSRKAQQGLATFYLARGQHDSALALYHELANVEETAIAFRTVGWAGEAIVYDLEKQEPEVRQRLQKIGVNGKLDECDRFLLDSVNGLIAKYTPDAKRLFIDRRR